MVRDKIKDKENTNFNILHDKYIVLECVYFFFNLLK